jgi:hypothetical protein
MESQKSRAIQSFYLKKSAISTYSYKKNVFLGKVFNPKITKHHFYYLLLTQILLFKVSTKC